MKNTILRHSLVLLLALNVVSCARAQPDTRSTSERAADLVAAFLETSGAPGIAVSVGRKGEIIWSEGFGYADLEQRVPVWPAISKFRVGSVAKPMTAVAIAQLYEAGKLDLDAPVQDYVPSFPEKGGVITTRLLAGHLAGIRHYQGDEFLSQKHYPTVLAGLDIFQDDPLLDAPGSAYSYSSYGWNLISAVIESAAQKQFLSYMEDHVFKAIGMNQTVADNVYHIIPTRTRYYVTQSGVPGVAQRGQRVINAPPVDNSYKWAGGGYLSTSEDLVKFGFAHLGSELLKAETREMMWTSQKTTAGEETGYGIGWRVRTDANGRRWVGHGGGSVGGTTSFGIYPDEELVIVLIANMSSVNFGDLPEQIGELFLAIEEEDD